MIRDLLLTPRQNELVTRAGQVAREEIAPRASEVDREARWPAESMKALGDAGLLGLQVPVELGGHGEGLLALAMVCEQIGQACAATGLCYGMHCVGTAVIAAKATAYQREHYLYPIAQGKHITTLSLSEPGTGSYFFLPQTTLTQENGYFVLEGTKVFVTNGGYADSYVVSTVAADPGVDPGTFSCVLVDRDAPNVTWGEQWHGFGMRGNSSRTMRLEKTTVPASNLLGEQGDQVWYVFEIIAPYFLMAMAGTYLGVAQAALDLTVQHLTARRYAHTGETPADQPVVQHRIAELWASVQKARGLLYMAAARGDAADPAALPAILAAKAEVADMVVDVTNGTMTLSGGQAYRENSTLARLLRDAHAAPVMAPTTDMLKLWIGRSILGVPLL